MSFKEMFDPPPAPKTDIGRLRILSPHAALRMSPLQFGGISLGQFSRVDPLAPADTFISLESARTPTSFPSSSAWADYTNTAQTKEESFALLDAFVDAGGVSFDTANIYSNEESETILGEWMAERGNRDRLVIATKFTECFQAASFGKNEAALTSGNSKKSLHVSLRESLRKLQTDYIDILYVHWYDYTTTVEELMDSLDHVVKQGKVLYLGVSDCPAWFIAACNTYARGHSKTPFSILSTRWNVIDRDFERDLLPMARYFGLAIAPWGVMAEGRLLSKKQLEGLKASGQFRKGLAGEKLSEDEVRYSEVLSKIGGRRGIDSVPPVALAYLFSKYPYVFPVVGVQNAQQISDNSRAMSIELTVEEIKEIEAVKPLDYGFPTSMVGRDPRETGRATGNVGTHLGTIDWLVDRKVYSSTLSESEKMV